jgi:PAS domain S-box-containing protein
VQQRFEVALRASPFILFNQDRDLRYTWTHNVGRSILGISDEELLGASAAEATALKRRVLLTGVGERRELRVEVGGRCAIYDTTIAPIVDDGRITGVAGVTFDVTEWRRAQRSEEEAQAFIQTFIRHVPVGLCVLDRQLRYLRINEALARINGLPVEEHLGRRVADVLGARAAGLTRLLAHVRDTGEPVIDLEVVWSASDDGEERHFLVNYYPIRIETEITGVGVVVQDITRHKVAESERRELLARERAARAEAEAANRMKDQFLATVSHELRAPLGSLLLWEHILRSANNDENLRRRAIDAIHESAIAQKSLIEDLLDVARGISGKLRIDKQPVDVVAQVASAIEAARPSSLAKELSIDAQLDCPPVQVLGDASRIQQVLGNLLANAIKFSETGGRIAVRVRVTELRWIEIAVEDHGRGIDRELLPHLFKPFIQAHACDSQQTGLGLGLAIVRQIVELLGGSVRAESEGAGRGATFVVTLPLLAEPVVLAGPRPLDAADSDELAGVSVLVIEDEPQAREGLALVLRRAGAAVDCVASTREALSALDRGRYCVVVSDIALPNEDGYSFARRLRQRPGAVPAIALTAHARGEDEARALAAGFERYLAKPVEAAELVAAIAAVTATRAAAPVV